MNLGIFKHYYICFLVFANTFSFFFAMSLIFIYETPHNCNYLGGTELRHVALVHILQQRQRRIRFRLQTDSI
jgi:hypothetical protein